MSDLVLASDADRDAAERKLREHFAAGRLTLTELDERLAAVHSARSRAEVDGALGGLPAPATGLGWPGHLVLYAAVNAALVLVWFLTRPDHPRPEDEGFGTSFWPIWSIVVWGAVLLLLRLRQLGRRRALRS